MPGNSVRPLRLMIALTLVLLVLATTPAWSQSPDKASLPAVPPELAKIRASLEKYQDPVAAVRDGYFSTLGCVEFPNPSQPGHEPYQIGAMGVHFVNPSYVSATPDPAHPPILLYEPEENKLRLTGVEWFVPLATGVKQRPELFGQPFYGPMEGHYPLQPAELHHYDLHVWIFKSNPAGLFSPTNPAVKCTGYAYAMQMESPKMVMGEKAHSAKK